MSESVPSPKPPLPSVPLPEPARLPAELHDSSAWIPWRAEWQWREKDGQWKLAKVPCDRNGRNASMTDPAIRSGLLPALTVVQSLRTEFGQQFGVGLTFCAASGFYALDLDGDLADVASERLSWLGYTAPTWGERSVSKRGAHLFYRGTFKNKRKFTWRGSSLEVFGTTGFVAMTGDVLGSAPGMLGDGISLLETILAEAAQSQGGSRPAAPAASPPQGPLANNDKPLPTNGGNPVAGDNSLLNQMFAAKNGPEIRSLWDGGGNADRSAGDLALCSHLGFWTGPDETAIDRLFRGSGRMREKWDERHSAEGLTYGQMTVRKALAGKENFYRGHRNGDTVADRVPAETTPVGPQTPRWPKPVRMSELTDQASTIEYLWEGYLARRQLTLLSALAKSGKTTLLGLLLRALQTGRPFLGESTRECQSLVVSEESRVHWRQRRDALSLNDHLSVLCQPMMAKPSPFDWSDFVSHVGLEAVARKCDLVVIDTVPAFAPWRNENDAAEVQAALLPLNQLTATGLAVLLVHHIGKGDGRDGRAARGSTALVGGVDVVLELRRVRSYDIADRGRVLTRLSRFSDPEERAIRLADDGNNYEVIGDPVAARRAALNAVILRVLPIAPPGLTSQEVHSRMGERGRPKRGDVGKALQEGGQAGLWLSAGAGKSGDPRRFWRSPS